MQMLIILIGSFQSVFVDSVKNVQFIAMAMGTYHGSFLTQGLFKKKSNFFLSVIGGVLKT